MKDLLTHYKEKGFNGKSDNTRKTYIKEIELFNEWLEGTGTDISNFSRIDVQHYINWLTSKNRSAATINKKYRALVHYCRFTNQVEHVKDIRVVKPQNLNQIAPKSLKRNEKNQMLREVARSGNKRNYALIVLLVNTGLRVNECSSLKLINLFDISEKKGFLRVEGKGEKERIVPLNSDVRYALNEYLKERSIDIYNLNSMSKETLQQPLFLSNFNKPLSVRRIQDIVEVHGKTHPHTLRHTFATELVREHKEDPILVAQILGHSNLSTIQRYTKATEEEMLNAVEKMAY